MFLKSLILMLVVTPSYLFASGYGYTKKKCESSIGANVVLPFNQLNQKIIQECMPEVLYSWKSREKISQYLANMTEKDFLPFGETLWTWRTPIGTFGYGDFALRIKLKKDLNIFWNKNWDESGGCKHLSANQKKNTVVFGYYGGLNYSEYVICSSEAIESWSYGTSEIQMEMHNEFKWVEKNKSNPANYDRFYRTISTPHFTDTDYSPENYFNFSIDGKDWSLQALKKKFAYIEELVNSANPGTVYYNKGVRKSRIHHYLVTYPDYFNL